MKRRIIAALLILSLTACTEEPLALKELFKTPFNDLYCLYIPTFVGGHSLSICLY